MIRDLLTGYVDAARIAIDPYMAGIRVVLGVVLLAGTVFAVWRITVWHEDHLRVEAMEAELAATKAELEQYRKSVVVAAEAYVAEIDRTTRLAEEDRKHAAKIEQDLQANLAERDRASRDLARRLHAYEARSRACAVEAAHASSPAAEPAAPGAEPGDGSEVGRSVEAHFAACARDAERLNGWRVWWAGVSERWRAAGYPVEAPPP